MDLACIIYDSNWNERFFTKMKVNWLQWDKSNIEPHEANQEFIEKSADNDTIRCTNLVSNFDQKCHVAVLDSLDDEESFKDSKCVVEVDKNYRYMDDGSEKVDDGP